MDTIPTDFCLEPLTYANEYISWVYRLMHPYLGKSILELGAGIGNFTPYMLRHNRLVTAIDIDDRLLHYHRLRVPATTHLHTECVSIQELSTRKDCCGRFDSVVSSNVLEHIPDKVEFEVVRATFDVLRPGGFSIHWVPALEIIFGSLDKTFRHHRRYHRKQLQLLFQRAGFEVVSCQYWNVLGFFGWWFTGRILGSEVISRAGALAFDRYLVPVVRRLEPWMWRPFGQSLLIIARRPALT